MRVLNGAWNTARMLSREHAEPISVEYLIPKFRDALIRLGDKKFVVDGKFVVDSGFRTLYGVNKTKFGNDLAQGTITFFANPEYQV